MQQLEKGIYFEDAYLGVTLGGFTFSHGVILIDAPLRVEDARTWRAALLNQRVGSNRLLVNLDAHPDRTLGTRAMDCTVLAHQKTALVFRSRPTIFKGQNVEAGADWEKYSEAIGMRWVPPDITFTDTMSLNWGGPEIVLEHHPGVSQGAIWAIVAAHQIIFVGDTLISGQPPFLDGADLATWQEELDLLLTNYAGYRIICGRGGLASNDDIRKMQSVVKKVARGVERVSKEADAPDATEEMVPLLLSDYDFSPERLDAYSQRLRSGLFQYFARRFHPTTLLEQPRSEEIEQ